MALTKIKSAGSLLLSLILTLGGGAWHWQRAAAQQPGDPGVQPHQNGGAKPAQGLLQIEIGNDLQNQNVKPAAKAPPGATIKVQLVPSWQIEKQPAIAAQDQAWRVTRATAEPSPNVGVAVAPGGKLVAVSTGNKVRIFDAATGKSLQEIHVPAVSNASFSADGKALITTTTQRWDLGTGMQVGAETKQAHAEMANVLNQLRGQLSFQVGASAAKPVQATPAEPAIKFENAVFHRPDEFLKQLAAKSNDEQIRKLAMELLARLGSADPKQNGNKLGGWIVIQPKPGSPFDAGLERKAIPVQPLELRLERLLQEVQELRRELHEKK